MDSFMLAFEAAIGATILITPDRVQVTSVAAGSVIVDFIITDPAEDADSTTQQEISADAAMARLLSTPGDELRQSGRRLHKLAGESGLQVLGLLVEGQGH